MRAGSLDSIIAVERLSTTVNEYGVPVETWAQVAKLRAQKIQNSMKDFLNASAGSVSHNVIVFRARFVPGITLDDRIVNDGTAFRLVEIKEIGRRRGLELRCERIGA